MIQEIKFVKEFILAKLFAKNQYFSRYHYK